MAQTYTVQTPTTLLSFLFENLEGWSKKTIKQRLQAGGFLVNQTTQTHHSFPLHPQDTITIGTAQKKASNTTQTQRKSLTILYQDSEIIAIDKPAGLLSVGTTKEHQHHALNYLRRQLSKGKKGFQLYPVNRLDRETSGIVLFATSKAMRESLATAWKSYTKHYLAIVENAPPLEKGTINQPLRLDEKHYHVHVGKHPLAKEAITHYHIEKRYTKHTLLEVHLETGRQHQIRAHLSWLGSPIVGDERYGKKGERMGLHAYRFSFQHPHTQKSIQLTSTPDATFYHLCQ
jgi:23S rRNA pseudouridine1911/1915/1917 synthase